jgi:hypothetical protein
MLINVLSTTMSIRTLLSNSKHIFEIDAEMLAFGGQTDLPKSGPGNAKEYGANYV